jgi:hypothetical protein
MKQHPSKKNTDQYRETRRRLQKENRKAYWQYLENIICYDESSFSVPNMVTFISGIYWKLSFSGGNSSSVFSGAKTEKYCLFNISWMHLAPANQSIPTKMINNSKRKLPWINREMKSLTTKRNKYFKKMHSTYGSKLKFSLSEYFNFLFAYLVITYYSLQFLSDGDTK